MTWAANHHVLNVASSRDTLAVMGKCAREAASTWTFREWAARIATRARPRDYVGQLRELYREILKRWRYVMEPEEWVHGSARSLIGHVLGVKYNAPTADPTRVDLSRVPTRHKGWGDCDDVATLVAAAAIALGMQPKFRVVRGSGGAHVSVLVTTPRGQVVSVDPVGEPDHGFGWAAPGESIELYDIDGRPSDLVMGAIDMSTAFAGPDGITGTTRGHWIACPASDNLGPRTLAMPKHLHRLFRAGFGVDGTPAFDEFGNAYVYSAPRDLWIDSRLQHTNLGQIPDHMGGVRDFFKRAKRRAKKRFAVVRRVVRRVVQKVRNVVAKILQSKAAQAIVGNVLRVYGVPARLTKGVMAASAEILKKGGVIGLVRLLRKDKKAVARLVAQAARAAGQRMVSLRGPEDGGAEQCIVHEGRYRYHAQPVIALAGVPYMYAMGAIDIAPTPTPGSYYRIAKGNTLLGVASAAYGTKSGTSDNLARARWINDAAANQPLRDPSLTDNLFKAGRISFSPRFAADAEAAAKGAPGKSYGVIYIPLAAGDEPPERTPDVPPGPTPDLPPPPTAPPLPPVDQPPLPPPGPVSPPPPTAPPTIEPPPPPAPPKSNSFDVACANTGGQVVTLPDGSKGCVKCGPNEVWSQSVGRCITRVTTTTPPKIDDGLPPEFCARGQTRVRLPDGDRCLPDDVAAVAEACVASGKQWTKDNRCYDPGYTPPPGGGPPPVTPPDIGDGLPPGFCPRGYHPDGAGGCLPDVTTPPPSTGTGGAMPVALMLALLGLL